MKRLLMVTMLLALAAPAQGQLIDYGGKLTTEAQAKAHDICVKAGSTHPMKCTGNPEVCRPDYAAPVIWNLPECRDLETVWDKLPPGRPSLSPTTAGWCNRQAFANARGDTAASITAGRGCAW